MSERPYANVWQKMLLEEQEVKERAAADAESRRLLEDYERMLQGAAADRQRNAERKLGYDIGALPDFDGVTQPEPRLAYDLTGLDNTHVANGKPEGGRDANDIIVNARRDTRDAIRYVDGLGQFDNVQRRARSLGLTETAAENAYFRQAALEAANSGGQFRNYPPSDHSAQLGLTGGGAIIAPGAGGSLQASLALNLPDVRNAGDFGLTGTLQAAGGVGGGAYAGTGVGAQAGYASNVPETLFSIGKSNYAEADIGAGLLNGSLSANLDDKGDLDSLGVNKGFGTAKAGLGGGLGAFVGKQGQVSITLTPNAIANILKGKVLTLPGN